MTKLGLKTRNFVRWAAGEGINDADLCATIGEMERGLVDDKRHAVSHTTYRHW